jgi:DNA-binding NarL/FixJ family response regulator
MVIDEHPLIHRGLKTLMEREETLNLDYAAASAAEALQLLQTASPDLIILDLLLGDADGTYLLQRIHRSCPRIPILVYTRSEEQLFGERAALAGARGYVMKTAKPAVLREAIHTILSGYPFFSEETMHRIRRKEAGRPVAPLSALDHLSNREMDIFRLVGEGLNALEISEKLRISKNTVDTHRINIRNKLELPNGRALDRFAYRVMLQGEPPE